MAPARASRRSSSQQVEIVGARVRVVRHEHHDQRALIDDGLRAVPEAEHRLRHRHGAAVGELEHLQRGLGGQATATRCCPGTRRVRNPARRALAASACARGSAASPARASARDAARGDHAEDQRRRPAPWSVKLEVIAKARSLVASGSTSTQALRTPAMRCRQRAVGIARDDQVMHAIERALGDIDRGDAFRTAARARERDEQAWARRAADRAAARDTRSVVAMASTRRPRCARQCGARQPPMNADVPAPVSTMRRRGSVEQRREESVELQRARCATELGDRRARRPAAARSRARSTRHRSAFDRSRAHAPHALNVRTERLRDAVAQQRIDRRVELARADGRILARQVLAHQCQRQRTAPQVLQQLLAGPLHARGAASSSGSGRSG